MVNCADTQIAAAALELPLGLVDLLGACAVVDGAWAARAAVLKRRFQNCDWRRRPLPSSDQVDYARGDATHLLALDAALWTRLADSPELERACVRRLAGGAPARSGGRRAPVARGRAPRQAPPARRSRKQDASSICTPGATPPRARVDESLHAVCPAAALARNARTA